MSVSFWVLVAISVVLSLLTSACLWGVVNVIVPPMIEVVPNLKWTGLAKSLVVVQELIMQYPIVLSTLPILVICCGIYQHRKLDQAERKIKFAVIMTAFVVLFLLGVILWGITGTYSMQDQMLSGMRVDI